MSIKLAATEASAHSARTRWALALVPDWHLYIMLAAVLAWTFVAAPDRFWTADNLLSMGFQLPELGLLALAVSLTLISGGISLAIVATANFAGFLMAFMLKASFVAGLTGPVAAFYFVAIALVGIAIGAAVGVANGLMIATLEIPPILVTLGTMTLLTGINLLFSKGTAVSNMPPELIRVITGTVFGIPVPLILMIVAALMTGFMLARSRLGVTLYMLGSNQKATAYSGINTRRVIVTVYMLSGALSGLAGFVMLCRFNSINSNYGSSYLLIAILAAVLGGVDPYGGRGRVTSICVALLLLQLISSLMNLMSWSSHLTSATWGLLLLVGLAFARRR